MWKVRIGFQGGCFFTKSSTEPREVLNDYGDRIAFLWTPAPAPGPDADTIGVVDWTRKDLMLAWRPEGRAKPARTAKAPKPALPATPPQRGANAAQQAILHELRTAGPLTERALTQRLPQLAPRNTRRTIVRETRALAAAGLIQCIEFTNDFVGGRWQFVAEANRETLGKQA